MTLIMRTITTVCACILLVPAAVFAYTNPGNPSGLVNDFAGMLAADERQALEAKLAAFEVETHHEIAVVTIPNLSGDTIENYAEELFKDWGIGKQGEDNGVLFLISRDDRDTRIEVGYGLEGALTDAEGFWILDREVIPSFRAGDFGTGIIKGADGIMEAVQGEIVDARDTGPSLGGALFEYFWIIPLLFIWLASILGRSKSWWAGGVVGGIGGIVIALIKGFLYAGLAAIVILVPLGLLFDFIVSRAYHKSKSSGTRPPWWMGGGGRGRGGFGGGGFGGFGGGMSGGGGASHKW